jgi:hypothetical protein
MSDLVERLNTYGTGSSYSLLLMREAADRIEALENALRKIAETSYMQDQALSDIVSAALAPEQDK